MCFYDCQAARIRKCFCSFFVGDWGNLYLNRRTFLAFNATDAVVYAKCSCVAGEYVVEYDYYIWDYYDFSPRLMEDVYALSVFGYADTYMVIGDTQGILRWDKD